MTEDEKILENPVDAVARNGVGVMPRGIAPASSAFDQKATIRNSERNLGITHRNYSVSASPEGGVDAIDIVRGGKALRILRRQADGRWKSPMTASRTSASQRQHRATYGFLQVDRELPWKY